jgi:hypothetical protein
VPWISSFQSGLHHATVTIDGETVVDEDFIQRGLLFKDRLPQITAGQPDNIAVQTTFGWTDNDVAIDDTISVDIPRWRAALGGSKSLAEAALSRSSWHDGNAVSFTINNLRETLTKNLQPLTQVPIDPLAKTYESNKTLNYAVQAQALASFRYFGMTDFGQVPGFRRDVILSNFQQNPPRAALGTPVVFEFDVNAINFESGNPQVDFGLAEEPQTGVFEFFSHGELIETDTGWHVRVPWTAAPLSSPSGRLFVSVTESNDSGKAAYVTQDFQVSLDEQNAKSTTVTIQDVSPDPIVVSQSTTVNLKAIIGSTGYNSPAYSWTVRFKDEGGNELLEQSGVGPTIDGLFNLPDLASGSTTKVTATVNATTTEAGGGTGGTVAGTGGGGGNGDGASVASADKTVDVQPAEQLTLSVLDGSNEIAVGYLPGAETLLPDEPRYAAQNQAKTKLTQRRRAPLKKIYDDRPSSWLVRLSGVTFGSGVTPPETVEVKVTPGVSKSLATTLTLNKVSSGVYQAQVNRQNLVDPNVVIDRPGNTPVAAQTTYSEVHAFFLKPPYIENGQLVIESYENTLSRPLQAFVATFLSILSPDGFTAPPRVRLGRFDEEALETLTDRKPGAGEDPAAVRGLVDDPNVVESSRENFRKGGFEPVKFAFLFQAGDNAPVYEVQAHVKVAHPASMLALSVHGFHTGVLNLLSGVGPVVDANTIDPQTESLWPGLNTLAFISCGPLDLRDYNNYYSAPFASGPGLHSPDAELNERRFGGEKWLAKLRALNSSPESIKMIGYAGEAPFRGSSRAIVKFKELLALKYPYGEAWIRANKNVQTDSQFWLTNNACAYAFDSVKQQFNYYFIQYRVPQITDINVKLPPDKALDPQKVKLWRIPEDKWDTRPESGWVDPNFEEMGKELK